MTNQRSKILAIDDRPTNLLTLGAVLTEEFDLQIATSGAMGLELIEKSPPDLILLDVMMPDMDGYEICRRLKKDPRFQTIPIIFITAIFEINAEIAGLALGASDYITKPINVEIAKHRIHNLLERERLHKEVEVCRDYLEALLQARTMAISIINDAIIMVNQNESVSFWNNAAERIFGYLDSEVRGLKIHELILFPMPINKIFDELAESGKIKSINGIREITLLSKDRKQIIIELSISGIYYNGLWKIIIVARDITDRKHTEHYITQIRKILHNTDNPLPDA